MGGLGRVFSKVRYIGFSNFTGWQLIKALYVSELKGFEKLVSLQRLAPDGDLLRRSPVSGHHPALTVADDRDLLGPREREQLVHEPVEPTRGVPYGTGAFDDEANRTGRRDFKAKFLSPGAC